MSVFQRVHMPALDGATGWVNSDPLGPAELRGHVVLVNFWTLTCINWLRQGLERLIMLDGGATNDQRADDRRHARHSAGCPSRRNPHASISSSVARVAPAPLREKPPRPGETILPAGSGP